MRNIFFNLTLFVGLCALPWLCGLCPPLRVLKPWGFSVPTKIMINSQVSVVTPLPFRSRQAHLSLRALRFDHPSKWPRLVDSSPRFSSFRLVAALSSIKRPVGPLLETWGMSLLTSLADGEPSLDDVLPMIAASIGSKHSPLMLSCLLICYSA